MYSPTPLYRRNVTDAVNAYCDYHHLSLRLVFDKTDPGEGRWERETATLYIGNAVWETPDWAGYYVVYRFLVLAHQSLRPADFSKEVAQSAQYQICADGTVAKWSDDGYRRLDMQAVWPHDGGFWQRAADNMPHLLQASEAAVEEAYDMLTNDQDRDNLHTLHYMASPKTKMTAAEYDALFARIDEALRS